MKLKDRQKMNREVRKCEGHIIECNHSYDSKTTVYALPRKWNKNMIRLWMDVHGIENYCDNSVGYYDCTGSVCRSYVELRKNKVTVVECYDV